jgi:hypothetical protein
MSNPTLNTSQFNSPFNILPDVIYTNPTTNKLSRGSNITWNPLPASNTNITVKSSAKELAGFAALAASSFVGIPQISQIANSLLDSSLSATYSTLPLSKLYAPPFIKLSDFEIEYPEEGDKIRGMIELEKKNNESKVSSVDSNEIIDNPLSDINQAYFKKNISGVPQTILDSIKSVYPSNWGKIDEEGCKTGEGLLDIETVGVGQRWSIMNYFDTNPKVIYILTNEFLNDHNNFTINDFKNWIRRESKKLFGENSDVLKQMVSVNKKSLIADLPFV